MKDRSKEAQDHRRQENDQGKGGYDPYREDPGAGKEDDERVNEGEEQDARQREGVSMLGLEQLEDSSTSPLVHTGIAGQTSRGSYGFNSSTGQGEYMDRSRDGLGDVGADPVAQPGDRISPEDLPDEGTGEERAGT
jgi:hypothetical protein